MATRISEGNAEGLIFYSIDQGKVLWSGCFQVVTFSYRTSVMALCKRKTQYKCYGIYSTLFNIYTGGGGGERTSYNITYQLLLTSTSMTNTSF